MLGVIRTKSSINSANCAQAAMLYLAPHTDNFEAELADANRRIKAYLKEHQ